MATAVGACWGCSFGEGHVNEATGGSVQGEIVAVVNGEAIDLDDVRRAVRETGLSPEAALRRIEARVLLLREARQRHVTMGGAAQRHVRQALVQALLIGDIEAEPVTEESLRDAYKVRASRFSTPERRASVHVLAKVKPSDDAKVRAAAEAFAERMIDLLKTKDFTQVAEEARELGGEQPFEVTAETLPPVSEDGALVRPYMDALFAASDAGVVAEPVETLFGWHAIRVTKIEPATRQSFDDVRETLIAEETLEQRKTAVNKLLKQVRERVPVSVHEDAIAELAGIDP